jgi:hypothetical protein
MGGVQGVSHRPTPCGQVAPNLLTQIEYNVQMACRNLCEKLFCSPKVGKSYYADGKKY